jgi:hypothetical protein
MTTPSERRRRRGYDTERAVAKYLGLERIAGSGKRDLDGGWLSVECKEKQSPVGWLVGIIAQAVRLAKPGQLPIGVIHFLGTRHDEDLVVLRLADFREWFCGEGDEACLPH